MAKRRTSRQKEKDSRQRKKNFAVSLFLLLWVFCFNHKSLSFCREVFSFVVSLFVFAVRFFLLPWGFFFCCGSFSFCCEVFSFAVSLTLFAVRFFLWLWVFSFLPLGSSFFRKLLPFAALWATVLTPWEFGNSWKACEPLAGSWFTNYRTGLLLL